MSIIIKSNSIATAWIENLNGLVGPQDWLYFADLENGKISKRVDDALNVVTDTDVFANTGTLNMLAKPITMNKSGLESLIASASDLRYLLDKPSGRYGLAAESNARQNWVSLSTAPANQTITLPGTSAVVAWIQGTGSMTLSSSNFSQTYVVTENNPVSIAPVSTSTTFDITVTFIGTITHAQLERSSGVTSFSSKITTPANTASQTVLRGLDLIELTSGVVSELKSGSPNGITVVFQEVMTGVLPEVKSGANVLKNLVAVNANGSSNSLSLTVTADRTYSSRQAHWTSENSEINPVIGGGGVIQPGASIVSAVTFKDAQMMSSVNGSLAVTSSLPTGLSDISSIRFGANPDDGVQGTGNQGIITTAVLFKRAMSENELKQLSSSWL